MCYLSRGRRRDFVLEETRGEVGATSTAVSRHELEEVGNTLLDEPTAGVGFDQEKLLLLDGVEPLTLPAFHTYTSHPRLLFLEECMNNVFRLFLLARG